MDFIHYNPSEEPLLAYDESSDEMDFNAVAIEYGEVQMLVDFDMVPVSEHQETEMKEVMDSLVKDFQEAAITVPKKYKKYGQDQIERLIRLLQEEGLTVPKAAEQCGIPRSSAYKLLDEFNAGNGYVLPGSAPKKLNKEPKKLFPQYSAFLIDLFDANPSIVLEEAKQRLCKNFIGLEISIAGLYKHIREKCSISLKQATKYTVERDAPRTIELRFNIITQWRAAGVNFNENCVFVDEAGFHSQMMRGRAWSKKGDPALVKVHTQKGVNISIVGCISPFGTICFSKVEPLKKSDAAKIEKEFPEASPSKKRKAESKPIQLKKGTTAYHIVKFMESVMDILDKHNKKGMFIVMDNCRIHHSRFVVDAINKRGYKPLFMPPYSPFLNPIEECWSKIKKNIKRNPLDKSDTLTPRIAEACKQVTVTDCQGWIRHAETYWDRCIQKENGLK
jgi:transposase